MQQKRDRGQKGEKRGELDNNGVLSLQAGTLL